MKLPENGPVAAVICHILHDESLLLLRKERGFGEGKYNAPGGKIEPEETPKECVLREVREETGLKIEDPVEYGFLTFYFGARDKPSWTARIFLAKEFSGTLKGGPEGNPQWTRITKIPYDEMWEDDRYWLPLLLRRQKFRGTFYFDEQGENILDSRLDVE